MIREEIDITTILNRPVRDDYKWIYNKKYDQLELLKIKEDEPIPKENELEADAHIEFSETNDTDEVNIYGHLGMGLDIYLSHKDNNEVNIAANLERLVFNEYIIERSKKTRKNYKHIQHRKLCPNITWRHSWEFEEWRLVNLLRDEYDTNNNISFTLGTIEQVEDEAGIIDYEGTSGELIIQSVSNNLDDIALVIEVLNSTLEWNQTTDRDENENRTNQQHEETPNIDDVDTITGHNVQDFVYEKIGELDLLLNKFLDSNPPNSENQIDAITKNIVTAINKLENIVPVITELYEKS